MSSTPRIEGLDQLRGALAVSVMIYHYFGWAGIKLHPALQRPLDQLGLSAVCTFYVLSGCALYVVYHRDRLSLGFLRDFCVKRTFRIVPLFWVATCLAALPVIKAAWKSGGDPQFTKLFLNLSMLFSWVDPAAYCATGAWSIGNEWAFYTLFPLLLWSLRSRTTSGLAFGGSLAAACWYAFVVFTPARPLGEQWNAYVHPLNHFVLFASGFFLGPLVLRGTKHAVASTVLAASTIGFVIFSYVFTTTESIAGIPRLISVAICAAWCYGFGTLRLESGLVQRLLTWGGAVSFSVYLLHPLVFTYGFGFAGKIRHETGFIMTDVRLMTIVAFIAIPVTLFLSHLVYFRFELPAVRLGRRFLSARPKAVAAPAVLTQTARSEDASRAKAA